MIEASLEAVGSRDVIRIRGIVQEIRPRAVVAVVSAVRVGDAEDGMSATKDPAKFLGENQ